MKSNLIYIIFCIIFIIICGFVTINVIGYYELDVETKLIRTLFFIVAIGFAIIIGTVI